MLLLQARARSCGDINDWKFLVRVFKNLQKRPGHLGLIQFLQEKSRHFYTNLNS